mgnify:CR=1 FL=1
MITETLEVDYTLVQMLIKTIKEFFEAHPKVRFSITLKEDNVLPSNYDVGIGGFIPNQPYLFQRELFPDYNRIYASKEYLKKYGNPLAIEDLENHLERLTSFPISHLSIYLLTLTPTHKMYKDLPNEEEQKVFVSHDIYIAMIL